MEDSDKEAKTENPTEKRLNDAKLEGNVANSRELSTAAIILTLASFLAAYGEGMFVNQSSMLRSMIDVAVGNEELTKADMLAILEQLVLATGILWWPFFGSLMLASLLSSFIQNPPLLIGKRIAPQFSRISPQSGWKRIASTRNFGEFLKSLSKLGATMLVFSLALSVSLKTIVSTMLQSPSSMAITVSSLLNRISFSLGAVATFIAVVDLFWQRIHWWSDLKMTRQEIKDEFKQTEGDPIVKGRLRSLGRARARNRMMKAVPTATLIIANPTHIAIALRYNRDVDAAPVVVATGADIIALRIRAVAEYSQVPVFERIELARALYKVVKVDQIIPQQFYQAIAELIRAIYDIQES